MRWLTLLLALAGCTPTVNLQITPINPDVKRWQHDMTTAVNDHDDRLRALEGKAPADDINPPKGDFNVPR